MNYNKSYFEKYDEDNETNFIIEKKKNYENDNKLIILQDKIEELLLKLKFINSNKNYMSSNSDYAENLNNKIIDLIGIDNFILNIQSPSLDIIDTIDNIINKLNKKIISKGQIKRKNDYIEFEF